MATEKQITERWGATHEIQKQRLVGEIDLSYLNKNESVAMGDGKTFYWLLTEKDVVKNNLVQADVGRSTVWKPTCLLRWINKEIPVNEHTAKKEKTLQQMWQGDMGEQEWKDIEFSEK